VWAIHPSILGKRRSGLVQKWYEVLRFHQVRSEIGDGQDRVTLPANLTSLAIHEAHRMSC
jgi:hypothetical protein